MKEIKYLKSTPESFDGERHNMYFLDELTQWSTLQKEANLESKAWIVHRKCLRVGKIDLADKIQEKYPNAFKVKSDLAIAFGYSLLAMKELKNK